MREKPNVGGICPYCGFDSARYHPPAHHLPLYATLCGGRYIMGRAIGSGGFGITYIAFDTRLDIPVAIKELFVSGKVKRERGRVVVTDTSGGEVRQYEEIKKRFMQEAMVLAEMETIEGLVKIKDYFQENDTAYIVMEYLDGKTMKDIFKKTNRRMSMDETIRVLTPIMDALTRLHKKGIIHRDVSLDNIMILRDNRIKLIDLGGGKRQGEGGGNTVAIKKSSYTPVEQILGRSSEIGPQTDVYALAVTIYRCICGKFPKPAGERESDNDIERPSKLGVKISKKQEATLLKALAIDPRKRIQTVPELYEGLVDQKKIPKIPLIVLSVLFSIGAITGIVLLILPHLDPGDDRKEDREVVEEHTLKDEISYTVNTSYASGAGNYKEGSQVTLEAENRFSEGYDFSGWQIRGNAEVLTKKDSKTLQFIMPAENVTVTALYEQLKEDVHEIMAKQPGDSERTAARVFAMGRNYTSAGSIDYEKSTELELAAYVGPRVTNPPVGFVEIEGTEEEHDRTVVWRFNRKKDETVKDWTAFEETIPFSYEIKVSDSWETVLGKLRVSNDLIEWAKGSPQWEDSEGTVWKCSYAETEDEEEGTIGTFSVTKNAGDPGTEESIDYMKLGEDVFTGYRIVF